MLVTTSLISLECMWRFLTRKCSSKNKGEMLVALLTCHTLSDLPRWSRFISSAPDFSHICRTSQLISCISADACECVCARSLVCGKNQLPGLSLSSFSYLQRISVKLSFTCYMSKRHVQFGAPTCVRACTTNTLQQRS